MGTAGCARLLLGFALVAALSGCQENAQNKDYNFDNPNDTTPSTGNAETGNVKIVLVKPSSPEVVVIVNLSAVFDAPMAGWTLSNNSTPAKSFTFPTLTLSRGQFVRFHSDTGSPTANDLYGTGADYWNPLSDIVTLKDQNGVTIDSCGSTSQNCWVN